MVFMMDNGNFTFMSQMMQGTGWPFSMFSGFWIWSLIILAVVFYALIDIMKRKDLDAGKRVGWVLIVLMAGFFPLAILGAIVYLIWGKKR